MPDNCRVVSKLPKNDGKLQKIAKMANCYKTGHLFTCPLLYNRLNLIYLHGKSVVIGFHAWESKYYIIFVISWQDVSLQVKPR